MDERKLIYYKVERIHEECTKLYEDKHEKGKNKSKKYSIGAVLPACV